MSVKSYHIVTALIAVMVAGACDDAISPARRALDGDWTMGHPISGLALGFNLRWTNSTVAGSGNYNAFSASGACALGLSGIGNVSLTADVSASNAVRGALTFDNGYRPAVTGTLTDRAGTDPAIDLTFAAQDGTTCPVTLLEGDIP